MVYPGATASSSQMRVNACVFSGSLGREQAKYFGLVKVQDLLQKIVWPSKSEKPVSRTRNENSEKLSIKAKKKIIN